MAVLVVALVGALVPTVFYVLLLWWIDRYEKEPVWLLAIAFLWGAGPAAILSVIFELLFDIPISVLGGRGMWGNLLSTSVGAPLIEESFKGIALIILLVVFYRAFDNVLDGIVYGAMIGLGFAMTENIVAYFLPILSEEGISAGLINIFMRTIVFGLNHAFWTGVTGAAVGYARLARSWNLRLLVPVGGWALAVLMHSLHNLGATLVQQTLFLSLAFSILVDWGGVMLLAAVVVLDWRTQKHWIERGLSEEVRRGVLSQEEFALLRSSASRWAVQWHARRHGGRDGSRAVNCFFQSATRLAFKKQHLRTLGDEGGNLVEIQRLRDEMSACRVDAWRWLWSTAA